MLLKLLKYKVQLKGLETPPYPPAHGDFAVYTIHDLIGGVDFTVSRVRFLRDHVFFKIKSSVT